MFPQAPPVPMNVLHLHGMSPLETVPSSLRKPILVLIIITLILHQISGITREESGVVRQARMAIIPSQVPVILWMTMPFMEGMGHTLQGSWEQPGITGQE